MYLRMLCKEISVTEIFMISMKILEYLTMEFEIIQYIIIQLVCGTKLYRFCGLINTV